MVRKVEKSASEVKQMNIKRKILQRQLTKTNIKLTGLAMKGITDLENNPEYLDLMDKRKLLMIKLYGEDK